MPRPLDFVRPSPCLNRAGGQTWACTLAALAFVGSLVACGSATPPTVVRHVGGERRVGTFVSPHSYEWFVRGELARTHGHLEQAVEAYRMARAAPQEDPLVLARLAETLDELGRPEEADRVLAEGFELDARSEALWLARGTIAERRQDWAAAFEAYTQAEIAAPQSQKAPLRLARLLRQRGTAGGADRALARYLHRVQNRGAPALRARLELALLREDADTAARAVRALMRAAPARAADVVRVAAALMEQGKARLASRLLDALPGGQVDPRMHIRTLSAAGETDRVEGLIATAPVEALGGPLERARLYLLADRADIASEIAEAHLGRTPADPDASLIAGQARLMSACPAVEDEGAHRDRCDPEQIVRAAEHLSHVPPGSEGYAAAQAGLAEALRAANLGSLADEILAAPPHRGLPETQ